MRSDEVKRGGEVRWGGVREWCGVVRRVVRRITGGGAFDIASLSLAWFASATTSGRYPMISRWIETGQTSMISSSFVAGMVWKVNYVACCHWKSSMSYQIVARHKQRVFDSAGVLRGVECHGTSSR